MSAETLRRAASLMRERAEAATPGPWVRSGSSIETDHNCSPSHGCWPVGDTYSGAMPDGSKQPASLLRADATHIASWHPAVALAVADWLDEAADFLVAYNGETHAMDNPLTVATAYLNEEPA